MVQHRAKAFQDLLNYPIKLNDNSGIGNVVRSADAPPTKQSYEALSDNIVVLVDKEITLFKTILKEKSPRAKPSYYRTTNTYYQVK
ncbi:MAG: hypothetical protein IPN94_12870 [Sphingobacteriales bacterium]|nr:hypothetical protein [Sphingobacteriales bacterium]